VELRPALGAFVLLASLGALLLFLRWWRSGLSLFGVLAVTWAAWCSNVYLPSLAPHWSQRQLISRYYALRADAGEPLIAYQMNWKGENFYTGNRVAAFVTTGEPFEAWVQQRRQTGGGVIYVVTEPSRIRSLERELGSSRGVQQLTSSSDNNKFVLLRVSL